MARMNRFAGRGVASFVTDGDAVPSFIVNMAGRGYVLCDKAGRRYADEYPQAALCTTSVTGCSILTPRCATTRVRRPTTCSTSVEWKLVR
jgi:hypothetical protein